MRSGPARPVAVVILVLMIATILSIGCSRTGPVETESVSVRMKWYFAGTMTGWFAGKEQGMFSSRGIDLQINPGGPDNSSVKLVAAGTDDFGVAGADEVLMSREKGIPVVAVAVLFKESPISFISRKGSGITSPADWSRKTIEVSYGGNEEVQYRALVDRFGVTDVNEVPYAYSLVPFVDGQVDVSVAYVMDQVVTLRRRGMELNVMTAKEYGINPYGDVIITSEKMLREKPALVRRFVEATIEGQKWAIVHPSEAVAALTAAATNLEAGNEAEVWSATIPFLVADGGAEMIGTMREQRWSETRTVLVEHGEFTGAADLESAYIDFQELP